MMHANTVDNVPAQGSRMPRARRGKTIVPGTPASSSNDGQPAECNAGTAWIEATAGNTVSVNELPDESGILSLTKDGKKIIKDLHITLEILGRRCQDAHDRAGKGHPKMIKEIMMSALDTLQMMKDRLGHDVETYEDKVTKMAIRFKEERLKWRDQMKTLAKASKAQAEAVVPVPARSCREAGSQTDPSRGCCVVGSQTDLLRDCLEAWSQTDPPPRSKLKSRFTQTDSYNGRKDLAARHTRATQTSLQMDEAPELGKLIEASIQLHIAPLRDELHALRELWDEQGKKKMTGIEMEDSIHIPCTPTKMKRIKKNKVGRDKTRKKESGIKDVRSEPTSLSMSDSSGTCPSRSGESTASELSHQGDKGLTCHYSPSAGRRRMATKSSLYNYGEHMDKQDDIAVVTLTVPPNSVPPYAGVLQRQTTTTANNINTRMTNRNTVRCYRCLEIGHSKVNCTGATFREDRCYRCGDSTHRIAGCKARTPRCPLCMDFGSPAGHILGGEGCKDCAVHVCDERDFSFFYNKPVRLRAGFSNVTEGGKRGRRE